MSGFTKGPWYVSPYKTSIGITSRPDGGYADRVAECDYWTPPRRGQPDRPEAEANALLIASAPDLLETLQQLEYWFNTDAEILDAMTDAERADHIRQHEKIRKAIAKALGEQA